MSFRPAVPGRSPPGARGEAPPWLTRRLLVFRPTAVPNQFQLVANSLDAPIGVVEAPVTPVSIPVLPGDRIGLRTFGSGDMPTNHPSAFPADLSG
jgi:hypothetical protein